MLRSEKAYGSGVLVSLDGYVFVLTSGHIPDPKHVLFMTPIEGSNLLNFQSVGYAVEKAVSLLKDPRKFWIHEDLQILLLNGAPEHWVKPLELSSEIAPTLPLTVYGYGAFCAENASRRLQVVSVGNLAKINVSTYQADPHVSLLTRCQLAISGVLQKLIPIIPLRYVNPKTKRQEGIIEATTFFDQSSLQTHIGEGFSGGPVMQDGKVIGAVQSANLGIETRLSTSTQTFNLQLFAGMWLAYVAGYKFPWLQKISPWLYDPLIPPYIGFLLQRWKGYTLSPLQRCMLASGTFVLVAGSIAARQIYANTQSALSTPKKTCIVRITPEIINWANSVLGPTPN